MKALLFLLPVLGLAAQVEEMPMREAIRQNNEWIHASDANTVKTAAATGSMRPHIRGGELLLLERYDGQPIEVGMWVVRPRWDKPGGVFHAVTAVSRHGYVKTQGTNCMYPDHWYPVERTRWIVRRVIRILPETPTGLLAASR